MPLVETREDSCIPVIVDSGIDVAQAEGINSDRETSFFNTNNQLAS
jgi:hypothetical protein